MRQGRILILYAIRKNIFYVAMMKRVRLRGILRNMLDGWRLQRKEVFFPIR